MRKLGRTHFLTQDGRVLRTACGLQGVRSRCAPRSEMLNFIGDRIYEVTENRRAATCKTCLRRMPPEESAGVQAAKEEP